MRGLKIYNFHCLSYKLTVYIYKLTVYILFGLSSRNFINAFSFHHGMISYLQAILLGIVQGITEWLPVSSSGHLVLLQEYFNLDVPVAFDVILHFGTLIVIFLVFWKDIINIIKSLIALKWDSNTKLLSFIVLGSIPIAIIGYTFHDFFIELFSNVTAIGIALLVTGTFLFLSKFPIDNKNLNWWKSIIIGLAQAAAIVPGISRSGATISAGLFMNVNRKDIAKFSFLLSIPAILGATVMEAKNLVLVNLDAIIIGTLTSIIVGYFALKFLLKLIQQKKFHYFSYYCWVLGLVVLGLTL